MEYQKTAALILFSAVVLLSAPEHTHAAPLSDQSISDAVEDELGSDRAIPVHRIDIVTRDGVVALTGTVDNILVKERAGRIAETVKAVIAVQNNIRVSPPDKTADAVIADRVKSALRMNPATDSYETTVTVSNGVVMLSGTVNSFKERQLAEKTAKNVRGVRTVTNDMKISYRAPRADKEIEADIEQSFEWDALLYGAGIDVEVKDGAVTLSGNVASAAEKSRARSQAYVAGVTSIDTSALNVSQWDWRKNLAGGKLARKNDRDIKAAIERKVASNPQVNAAAITADVSDGVATLRGKAESLLGKRAAAEEALTTAGVVRVKNRIKVVPSKQVGDARLSERISGALAADPYVSRSGLTVDVRNGTVALTGSVDTYFKKLRAETVAAGINGVTAIENKVRIEDAGSILAYDPYVYDYYVYDLDWFGYQPFLTPKTDAEIKNDIGNELFWSPFVDVDSVTVAVQRGVATLTGTVDSWPEFQAATENALEGGATGVVNNLKIAG